MRLFMGLAIFSVLAASAAFAKPDADKDMAQTFVTAVRHGDDLAAAYSDALKDRELASLQRLKGCVAGSMVKQKTGEYTLVWSCKAGMLGMRVTLSDGKLQAVETFEVVMRRAYQ